MGLVFSLSFYLNELVSGGLGINGDSISASWLRSFKSFVLEKDNIQPLTGRFILKWQLWQCLIVTHCKTKQPQIFFHRLEWWRMIHHRLVPNPRIRTESELPIHSKMTTLGKSQLDSQGLSKIKSHNVKKWHGTTLLKRAPILPWII